MHELTCLVTNYKQALFFVSNISSSSSTPFSNTTYLFRLITDSSRVFQSVYKTIINLISLSVLNFPETLCLETNFRICWGVIHFKRKYSFYFCISTPEVGSNQWIQRLIHKIISTSNLANFLDSSHLIGLLYKISLRRPVCVSITMS